MSSPFNKWSSQVSLSAKYVWVLLQSCNNTGNTQTQKLSITKSIACNLTRSSYKESIERAEQKQGGSVSLNMDVPIISDVVNISGGGSASWASSNWQQYTTQLSSQAKVDTSTSMTWTFEVGPNCYSDFYRLNFMGPAGLVETDTTAIVPGGTKIKDEDLTIVTSVYQEYSVWATPFMGGDGGEPFDDGAARGIIQKLTIRSGRYVDNVTGNYANATTGSHGGGGGDARQLTLDAKDPIGQVIVHSGRYVDYVELRLRSGITYKFGGDGGDDKQTFNVPLGYNWLTSLVGRSGRFVDAVQFVFTNQPPQNVRPN